MIYKEGLVVNIISDTDKFRDAANICREMAEIYDELATPPPPPPPGEVIPDSKVNEVIGKFVVLATKMKALE